MSLTREQQLDFNSQGFAVLSAFDEPAAQAMLDSARAVADRAEQRERARPHRASGKAAGLIRIGDALLQPESALTSTGRRLRERTSKIFRLHRDEAVFHAFACSERVTSLVRTLLGDNVDCFLSQFIFKQPGALGQPWHQDGYYFPFDNSTQLGLWLAVTAAHADNGPLWVLPGSHLDPIHPVVPDQRPHANAGYVEIINRDTQAAEPVLMQPGDLLVFHPRLLHRSTDNQSAELRAAMVYHFATSESVDLSHEHFGRQPANQDWLPVLRQGEPVPHG